jgi:hypothetical protein
LVLVSLSRFLSYHHHRRRRRRCHNNNNNNNNNNNDNNNNNNDNNNRLLQGKNIDWEDLRIGSGGEYSALRKTKW